MNPSFHLYQLQKVDRQLLSIEKRIDEIDALIRSDLRIAEVESIINQINNRVEKLKKELRAEEEKGKTIRLEIETNESSLYSGTIRNPKELNDLQQKINMDKKNFEKNEEAQLNLLMSIEDYEGELERYKKKRTEVESIVATAHSQLLGEKSQMLKQKATLETERTAKSSSVQGDTLAVYSKLIREKHGVAVALIEELSCTMCGEPLTPADWQSARSSSKLSFCSSCGRILYAS